MEEKPIRIMTKCDACGTEHEYKYMRVTDYIGSGKTVIRCVACFDEDLSLRVETKVEEPKKRGRPKKETANNNLPADSGITLTKDDIVE